MSCNERVSEFGHPISKTIFGFLVFKRNWIFEYMNVERAQKKMYNYVEADQSKYKRFYGSY